MQFPAPLSLRQQLEANLTASPYLAEARQRLKRFRPADLVAAARPHWFSWSSQRKDAYHLRLAEAWKQTQASLTDFERQWRAKAALAGRRLPVLPLAPETIKTIMLTHYCANILHYQATLGKRADNAARPIPVEWMQMAAAAAMFAVVQTALMLWVLRRPAPRPFTARRRTAPRQSASAPQRTLAAIRVQAVPLRL